jgi:hypothetical protein
MNWKGVVIAEWRYYPLKFSRGAEENGETPHDSRCPGRDSNSAPPEYESIASRALSIPKKPLLRTNLLNYIAWSGRMADE